MKWPPDDGHVVGRRVRGIPLRRQADPPLAERRDRLGRVVEVFALGVDELAEPARAIDLPHRVAVVVERRGLEHHVLAAARLDRLVQLVGLLDRAEDGRHGAGDVLAVLEHLDAVPGMAGRVGRHEDRLDASRP